jgi:hypothetical protein
MAVAVRRRIAAQDGHIDGRIAAVIFGQRR